MSDGERWMEVAWEAAGSWTAESVVAKVEGNHQWLVVLVKVWVQAVEGSREVAREIFQNAFGTYPWWCSKTFLNVMMAPMARASFETRKALMERMVTPARASNHQPTCEATKNEGTKNCICFLPPPGPKRRRRPAGKSEILIRHFHLAAAAAACTNLRTRSSRWKPPSSCRSPRTFARSASKRRWGR
jgi:hypothetical protein